MKLPPKVSRWWALAFVVAACTRSSPPTAARSGDVSTDDAAGQPSAETRSDAMATSMDPNPAPSAFTRGAPIAPSADLLAWLGEQRTPLRLPFTLTLSSSGGVATATIGVNGEADPVAVKLSDLGMGISLKDRLRKVCKPGETCAVWLIGTWTAGDGGGADLFNVRKLDGAITDPSAATHAEVETK